ncbi:MAG: hypothetical protein ACKVPX_13075 [Myxococcaceae bacterium]
MKPGSMGLLAAALLLSSCVAHESNGDRAAALGDWRNAYASYREAVGQYPDDPKLRRKFESAKVEALRAARSKAQTCAAATDWPCAASEAEFALSLEPSDTALAQLYRDASTRVALAQVEGARDAARRLDFETAFQLLRSAGEQGTAEVQSAAMSARGETLQALSVEAERLWKANEYPQAIALWRLSAPWDGAHRVRLERAEREYRAVAQADYDRRMVAADAALAQRRFADAEAQYRWAAQVLPGAGPAETRARYAGAIALAERAVAGRNYGAAESHLREAIATGEDRDGFATTRLDEVRPRPHEIRLVSVLVFPMRPTGAPWTGGYNPALELLARLLRARAGDDLFDALAYEAHRIPPASSPTLQVDVQLPDGTTMSTVSQQTLHAQLDAPFVITSNAFDDRRLRFRIRHVGIEPADAALFDVPIRDLLGKSRHVLTDRGAARLWITTTVAAEGTPPGPRMMSPPPGMGAPPPAFSAPPAFSEPPPPPPQSAAPPSAPRSGPSWDSTFKPESAAPPPVPAPPPPAPSAQKPAPSPATASAFTLTGITAEASRFDYQDELKKDGAPDLVVEIEQQGRVVYRSPRLDNQKRAAWKPEGLVLFLSPKEELQVRLLDEDEGGGHDVVLNAALPAAAVQRGAYQTRTPRGSYVNLTFAPAKAPAASTVSF